MQQRLSELAAAVVDLGEPADRGQVFRSAVSTRDQLGLRLVELTELDERAPERHAGRQIRRMNLEARAARIDRLLILPGATHSSASWAKAIDAGSFWTRRRKSSMREFSAISIERMPERQFTVTSALLEPDCPMSSVIVRSRRMCPRQPKS